LARKRVVDAHGVIIVDGSRYYVGESRWCETITVKDGPKFYDSKNKPIMGEQEVAAC